MPAPEPASLELAPQRHVRLTARERAVLRRLVQHEDWRAAYRGGVRQRSAVRQRRRVLSQLGANDLRNLMRIMLELKL